MPRPPDPRAAFTDAELTVRFWGWGLLVLAAAAVLVAWMCGLHATVPAWALGVYVVVWRFTLFVMQCWSWGKLLERDCMCCPYCGYPVAEAALPGLCPECGRRLNDREFVRDHWIRIYGKPEFGEGGD